jgi:hypothetical protein
MEREKHSPSKDYRDIGEVVTLMDNINAARKTSSFYLNTEALLASNKYFDRYIRQNRNHNKPSYL